MKNIKIFLKGIIIGFASVGIPGLSASTVAIILGIYYLMIDAINKIFKDFKASIKFLFFLILGYAVGAILAGNLFNSLFNKYSFIVILTVLGLIIGSIPKQIKEIKPYKNKVSNWILVTIIWIFLLIFNLLVIKKNDVVLSIDMSFTEWMLLILVGLISAATLVIPGMDYNIILLSLGYYNAIMSLLNVFLGIKIIDNLIILSVYLVSYGIGAFLISKVINSFKEKNSSKFLFANFAFVSIAPLLIIKYGLENNQLNISTLGKSELVLGIILFIISFAFIVIFNKVTDPNDTRIKAMKKRHMFRFFYTIISRFPLPIRYIIQMKKIIKEDKLTFDDKYKFCLKIIKKINKLGNIYVKSYGIENMSSNGTLYISNHQGRYDGLGILTAMEEKPVSIIALKSRVDFPMYKELFTMLNGIEIDLNDMRKQLRVMNEMAERLKSGESFLGFIEGKYGDNGNTLQDFKTGILHPVYKSKADIVPILLYDSYKVFSISSLRKIYPEVHFLKKIEFEEYKNLNKQELAELIKQRMQDKINELNEKKGRNI